MTAAVLAVALGSGTASARPKDRERMQMAAQDSSGVCLSVLVAKKSLQRAAAPYGFELSKATKIGKVRFDALYQKSYGWGLHKTHLFVGRTAAGYCVSMIAGNYESKTYWTTVSQLLERSGLKPRAKPIIASGMFLGAYRGKSGKFVAQGRTNASHHAITIFSGN